MKNILRNAWQLARPYWSSEEKWKARGLLAVIVTMTLTNVYLSVLFNSWYNAFYSALQKYDKAQLYHQLLVFSGLATIYVTIAVYQLYLTQMLQIRWRRWLTHFYIDRWLGDRTYYLWQLTDKSTDNPDQRISEDVGTFIDTALNLSLGLLREIVTLVSFTSILWALSGPLTLGHVTVPGYMVWVCLVYAVIGTWLTFKIGRRMAHLNFQQQRFEADYRFSLVRLRENGESVALSRGEAAEDRYLRTRFGRIVENFQEIMRQTKKIVFVREFYGQAAVIFPFVVSLPRYLSKAIDLGGLMQIASTFGKVQGAMSFFVDAYLSLANWQSVIQRLVTFEESMAATRQLPVSEKALFLMTPGQSDLKMERLTLTTPQGEPLFQALDWSITSGRRVLLSGPSGCGKSTLVRTVAGLWPYATGRILLPAGFQAMVLPQKPYLPVSPLREALCYPAAPGLWTEAEIERVLGLLGLEHLQPRLAESANWALILSGGEQQRVALARIFLHRPAWVFLDEATSALDEDMERKIYTALRLELPLTTLISIGHRESLIALHEERIDLSIK